MREMLKRLLNRLMGGLSESAQQEWVTRFVLPHVKRGYDAGIPSQRLDEIVAHGINTAQPPYTYPGCLIRDMINGEIEKRKKDEEES